MKTKKKVQKFLEEHQPEIVGAVITASGLLCGMVLGAICTRESDEYKIGDTMLKRIPSDVEYGFYTIPAGISGEKVTPKHPMFFAMSNEDYEHFKASGPFGAYAF